MSEDNRLSLETHVTLTLLPCIIWSLGNLWFLPFGFLELVPKDGLGANMLNQICTVLLIVFIGLFLSLLTRVVLRKNFVLEPIPEIED